MNAERILLFMWIWLGRRLVGFLEKHRLKTRANHFSPTPRNDLFRCFEFTFGLKSQSRINVQTRMNAEAKGKRSIQFTCSPTVCLLSGCFHLDVDSQRDHWRHLHFVAATTHQNSAQMPLHGIHEFHVKRQPRTYTPNAHTPTVYTICDPPKEKWPSNCQPCRI